MAEKNDGDLLDSHVVLVIAREAVGGEMFSELRLALVHQVPVIYLGERRVLSAYRAGVTLVEDLDAALTELVAMRDVHLSAGPGARP